MTFSLSEDAQTIKVFNLRADTHEFIGAGDAYIPPHTGLPANCTLTAPPEIPAGQVAIWDEQAQQWALLEDHRGETVYDTTTGLAVFISEPGALPKNTTTVAPSGQYQKWDGKSWVKDEAAEKNAQVLSAKSQVNTLLQTANARVTPLQDAVDLDMATDVEKKQLAAWKKYRVLLSRVDTSTAPDITWPEQPSF